MPSWTSGFPGVGTDAKPNLINGLISVTACAVRDIR